MAEFAGYNMPISYAGINAEHAAVRNNAGVFDVSHMGEFILKVKMHSTLFNALPPTTLQRSATVKPNTVVLPITKAGIVDDLIVYCIEENKVYMLVVNASNIEKRLELDCCA